MAISSPAPATRRSARRWSGASRIWCAATQSAKACFAPREESRSVPGVEERLRMAVCNQFIDGPLNREMMLVCPRHEAIGARFARAVNHVFARSGPVLADRYHVRMLRTPREVRSALAYVLLNARMHATQAGRTISRTFRGEPASSAPWFEDWPTASLVDRRPLRAEHPLHAAVGLLRRAASGTVARFEGRTSCTSFGEPLRSPGNQSRRRAAQRPTLEYPTRRSGPATRAASRRSARGRRGASRA